MAPSSLLAQIRGPNLENKFSMLGKLVFSVIWAILRRFYFFSFFSNMVQFLAISDWILIFSSLKKWIFRKVSRLEKNMQEQIHFEKTEITYKKGYCTKATLPQFFSLVGFYTIYKVCMFSNTIFSPLHYNDLVILEKID